VACGTQSSRCVRPHVRDSRPQHRTPLTVPEQTPRGSSNCVDHIEGVANGESNARAENPRSAAVASRTYAMNTGGSPSLRCWRISSCRGR
jgi:hypothetical protein